MKKGLSENYFHLDLIKKKREYNGVLTPRFIEKMFSSDGIVNA